MSGQSSEGVAVQPPGAALVVDSDAASAQRTSAALTSMGLDPVQVVGDIEAARRAAEGRLAVVVCSLDVGEDGAAQELVRELSEHRDGPRVIATCVGSEGRLIADALLGGAYCFVARPIVADDLVAAVEEQRCPEAELQRLARRTVGRLGVKEAVSTLRGAMVQQALERENFSRRGTAKLLGVDRRVIQRAITEDVQPYSASRARKESGLHEVVPSYDEQPTKASAP